MIFNEIFPQFFPYSFHIHYKALVVFIYTYFEFSAQILKKKMSLYGKMLYVSFDRNLRDFFTHITE